jgi:hypothetical protein
MSKPQLANTVRSRYVQAKATFGKRDWNIR